MCQLSSASLLWPVGPCSSTLTLSNCPPLHLLLALWLRVSLLFVQYLEHVRVKDKLIDDGGVGKVEVHAVLNLPQTSSKLDTE